jgi:hypothetical protein
VSVQSVLIGLLTAQILRDRAAGLLAAAVVGFYPYILFTQSLALISTSNRAAPDHACRLPDCHPHPMCCRTSNLLPAGVTIWNASFRTTARRIAAMAARPFFQLPGLHEIDRIKSGTGSDIFYVAASARFL